MFKESWKTGVLRSRGAEGISAKSLNVSKGSRSGSASKTRLWVSRIISWPAGVNETAKSCSAIPSPCFTERRTSSVPGSWYALPRASRCEFSSA